jgi:LemA protein
MDDRTIIILAVIGVVVLIPFVWFITTYNRFVGLRQHIRESWADIDVELKRRYDLIPNLVETVKGYAAHERGVLERVIELRNKAAANHGSAASQAMDESALLMGLKQLFVVAEAYPRLKPMSATWPSRRSWPTPRTASPRHGGSSTATSAR